MDREYSLRLEKIEALLDEKLPLQAGESWLNETFPSLNLRPGQTEHLTAPGRELLKRGGKRWRPLLSLLVCEASGGDGAVMPLLPLVEFPHNASLIHDDIEDNSECRRGRPAIHLIYGNDTAVNSGCFLYFLPLACIETWDAPAESKNLVWSLWAEHMRRLHLGQSMDIAWHRDFFSLPSLEDYFFMCSLKTGCLARFAAVLGLAASQGGTREFRDAAERYGAAAEKLGTGFQILDDVKNLAEGVPGKKRGDDIAEGKKSLPVLLYLHGSGQGRKDRAAFTAECFRAAREGGVSVPETEAFIAELENAGVLEEARLQGENLISMAEEVFAGTAGQSPAGRLLAGFAELLR